jgi:DNA-binding CsgD family transcriptional regulator
LLKFLIVDRTHWIIAGPGTAAEKIVPVNNRLVVGRECVGTPPAQRLLLDDPSVSRNHLEIRIGPSGDATLIDVSTNGTRVNGAKVPRGNPIAISDGDTMQLGGQQLQFRSLEATPSADDALRTTIRELEAGRLTVISEDPLASLTEREREILALIAQGNSNAAIAERLVLSVRTVEAHVRNIFLELRIPETSDDNRRVHAVLTYLRAAVTDAQA